MRIEGAPAQLSVKVNPEKYGPFLSQEKGKPVIYVKLAKALYGTLQAAYLFYLDLSRELESMGFVKTITTSASPIKQSTISSAPSYGMWTI